ncbi:unnamed protein product, partial [Clonostachys rhizophaga]
MSRSSRARTSRSQPAHVACSHDVLYNSVSAHARSLSYYACPSTLAAHSAASRTRRPPDGWDSSIPPTPRSSFPSSNVLPQDHLDQFPKEPGDDLYDFITNGGRNQVTPKRKCLYIVDAPDIDPEIVGLMASWTDPAIPAGSDNLTSAISSPRVEDIAGYLAAFYTGLDVKILKSHFRFKRWGEKQQGANANNRGNIALVAPDGAATRVRFRPAPDGATPGQLNLNDMLDALHASIPPDAFAILLVTDHDLYEDEEDDFCAGRLWRLAHLHRLHVPVQSSLGQTRWNQPRSQLAGISLQRLCR